MPLNQPNQKSSAAQTAVVRNVGFLKALNAKTHDAGFVPLHIPGKLLMNYDPPETRHDQLAQSRAQCPDIGSISIVLGTLAAEIMDGLKAASGRIAD